MNKSDVKLRPCPFCASEDLEVIHLPDTIVHPAYYVRCNYCETEGPVTDKGDHREQWNGSLASTQIKACKDGSACGDSNTSWCKDCPKWRSQADIAQPVPEPEPTLYQARSRPMWRDEGTGWSSWEDCSAESYESQLKLSLRPDGYNDWQYQVRKLYTSPIPQDLLPRVIEALELCYKNHGYQSVSDALAALKQLGGV